MKQEEKICFVIMGFGEKKDPVTNRTINLDETYKKIIRPAVEACNIRCVRADEITDSGIIDRSMYALLYRADIVIADISTDNPNAVYELGVRHTMKPFSTVIIREGNGKIPFDFSHNRVLNYEHLGNEISKKEAQRCIIELRKIINTILEHPTTDSPLYTYIPKISQPFLSNEDLSELIGELKENENSIYTLTEKAKVYMQNNNFLEAANIWKLLSEKVENEIYYIQQAALCTYKSQKPSKLEALTNALIIISNISGSIDTETLGINGAICKRLWEETREATYLDRAIDLYHKGWVMHKDYYAGENYAFCMSQKAKKETGDEQVYCRFAAKKVYEEVVEIIQRSLTIAEPEELKWKYATLANCYLACGDHTNATKYETEFMNQNPLDWEVATYNKTKDNINQK